MKKKRPILTYIIPFYRGVLNKKLLNAVESNDISLARRMLEKGADPNYSGVRKTWPVFLASLGNREISELLLDYGADINCCDGGKCYSGLIRAARNGDVLLTRFLLENGADPLVVSFCGLVPLVYAVEKGSKEVVQLILSYMDNTEYLEECITICKERNIPHSELLVNIKDRVRQLTNHTENRS